MTDRKEGGKDWLGELERYSHKVRLAGLGAYSKMSKDGARMFEDLVRDGEAAEEARKPGPGMQDEYETADRTTRQRFSEARQRASERWSDLEEMFDRRLAQALERLGVPSREELQAVNQRLDALAARLDRLDGSTAPGVVDTPIIDPEAPHPDEAPDIILPDDPAGRPR